MIKLENVLEVIDDEKSVISCLTSTGEELTKDYHRASGFIAALEFAVDFANLVSERRKAFVIKTRKGTGFDVPEPPVKRDLVPPSAEDLAGLKLKSPAAPASDELKEILWRQGYFTTTEQEETA